jgi:hypothetical protein
MENHQCSYKSFRKPPSAHIKRFLKATRVDSFLADFFVEFPMAFSNFFSYSYLQLSELYVIALAAFRKVSKN